MITAKNAAYRKFLSNKNTTSKAQDFKDVSRNLWKKIREMKTKRWEDQAKELQLHANKSSTRSFYSSLREVWGPTTDTTSRLKAADRETILTKDQKILELCAEHLTCF